MSGYALEDFKEKTKPDEMLAQSFIGAYNRNSAIKQVCDRTYSRQQDTSPSGWDYSLIYFYLLEAPEVSDQDLIATASFYRLKHNPGDTKSPPA